MKKLFSILFISLFIFSCDNNKKQEIYIEYFENGLVKTVGWTFIDYNNKKVKHGPWIEYYEDGVLNYILSPKNQQRILKKNTQVSVPPPEYPGPPPRPTRRPASRTAKLRDKL